MIPNINYIGNKKKLISWILDIVPKDVITVVDAFAGGGSVAYSLKEAGYNVIANDVLYSSYEMNKGLIENDNVFLSYDSLEGAMDFPVDTDILKDLKFLSNNLYFEEEVIELARLISYSEKNLTGYEYSLFITNLRRAMIRKLPYSRMNINWENIIKLRDEEYSYKKYGRKRAYHNESFMNHMLKSIGEYNLSVFEGKFKAKSEQLDVLDLLEKYPSKDLLYLDPPYPGTMNNYDAFYGPFDQIFKKQIPHIDLTKKNDFIFNMEAILNKASLGYKYAMISLNNSIKPSFEEFLCSIKKFGEVKIYEKKHNYQISGKDNKQKNIELIALIIF